MNDVVKIAAGVALGLAIVCGGGCMMFGVLYTQGAAKVERDRRNAADTKMEKYGPEPRIGDLGLAVPVERFIHDEWRYDPQASEVKAYPLKFFGGIGWSQFAIFEHDDKVTGWDFTIIKDKVTVREVKSPTPAHPEF